MIIINHPDRLIVSKWPKNPVAVWGIQAYSFLLPHNKPHTARQLAELIPLYYDKDEPHTAAVIKALLESERHYGPQEPPHDPRIYNQMKEDGTYPPLKEFFMKNIK